MQKSKVFLLLILLFGTFLRFCDLDKNPPGLYIDEASIGYNANQILQTGKDEFGLPYPLFFKSFGDYKMPVYIYATAASIELFGKNEFAIRFPSALFGVLTLLLFYLFINELFETSKAFTSLNANRRVSLLGTFLLAISSWHIQFSRGGFEVNVGLFFYLLGCYLALVFWDKKRFWLFMAASISFVIALYTYHIYRILVPITWGILFVFYTYKFSHLRKKIIFTTLLFLILCLPILMFSFTPEGSVRFAQTSSFSEYKADTLIDKITLYPMVVVKNYLSFYSSGFLFAMGDGNGRHQVPGMGLLYRWELPFLLIGFFWLIKQKRSSLKYVTLGLLLFAPLAGSIVRPSPHSLRSLVLVIPLTLIISMGLISTYSHIKRKKKIFVSIVGVIALFEFIFYIHLYYIHYPNVNALDWGAGYKDTVYKAQEYSKKYPRIVIDKKLDFASVYFNFYGPTLHPTYVDETWVEPKEWAGKTIYIRPFYGNKDEPQVIDQVYLPGGNKDIFAQFWKL